MSDHQSLYTVIAALDAFGSRYRQYRDHLQAQCPGHPDNRASLSIDWKPAGKVVMHCHAMCKTEDVMAALNLGWPDLWDEPREPLQPKRFERRPSRRPVQPVAQPVRPRRPVPQMAGGEPDPRLLGISLVELLDGFPPAEETAIADGSCRCQVRGVLVPHRCLCCWCGEDIKAGQSISLLRGDWRHATCYAEAMQGEDE